MPRVTRPTLHRHRPVWTVALAIATLALAGASQNPSPSDRGVEMRGLAEAIALKAADGAKAERVDEPIYRFDDPARGFADGTVWAYGRSGRPAALLSLALIKNNIGQPRWVQEMVSLADGPLAGTSQHATNRWNWNPKTPGITLLSIPDAGVPAGTEPGRLRQMKDAARRFKAFESFNLTGEDPSDRFELRLLPQPLVRYRGPDPGVIDGAIFLLAYGQNPEIALVIEARRAMPGGTPAWSYGLARISSARLRVSLDGREVADMPRPTASGPTDPYFLMNRPALDLKN